MQLTEGSVQSETGILSPRVKMVSLTARSKADRHQFVNGFKNIAYLVGYVRHLSKSGFLLQMNNSENLMIPIRFSPGRSLPRGFQEREPVKVYAQMVGRQEGDFRRTYLFSRREDRPNVLELPNARAFLGPVHAESTEDATFKPYGSGNSASSASNQAMIAGYVAGYSVREARVTEDGSEINGRLLIDIQQTEDPRSIIQVRLYGARYSAVAARLRVGMALVFYGKIRTDVVPTGRKDETTGKDIVMPYAYLQVDVPEIPSGEDIKFLDYPDQTPKWVKTLAEQSQSRPKRSLGTEANGSPASDGGGAAAAPSAPATPAPRVTVAAVPTPQPLAPAPQPPVQVSDDDYV